MARIPIPSVESLTLENLQNELSKAVEKFWHSGLSTGPLDGQDWAPAVELRDEPTQYRAVIELPGVAREAIDVTLQGLTLIVCGNKPNPAPATQEAATPATRLLRSERRYGGFKREIPLPGPIKAEGIAATLTDGVLDVIVPKDVPAEAASVRVKVTVADSSPQS